MNEQTVDATLGGQGGTVDPKTGSPHMLPLVQIQALSLANGVAWGGGWGSSFLFPRGFKFLTGILPSLVWESSEPTHIRCLAEDLIYINTP